MRKSEDKKSFQLYNDYIQHFNLMSDEDAGKLIKAIFSYVNDQPYEELKGMPMMAFSFISSQLKRDKDKYDARCEANRRNGSLGGRPKKIKENEKTTQPQKANGYDDNQKVLDLPEVEPHEEHKEVLQKEQKEVERPKQKKVEYTSDFEKFWQIYPRKDDKGEAYKKYSTRLKSGWSSNELETAANNYRMKCEREHTEKKYIKQAKTFLSDTTPFVDYLPKKEQQTVPTIMDDNINPWRE